MNKEEEIAEKERQAFLWMKEKGYDRRAAKDISPILVKYHQEQLRICAVSCQREQLPIYYQIKNEFITDELKKRFPSIMEWAFEKEWWIGNNIASEEEIQPLLK